MSQSLGWGEGLGISRAALEEARGETTAQTGSAPVTQTPPYPAAGASLWHSGQCSIGSMPGTELVLGIETGVRCLPALKKLSLKVEADI